MIYQLRELNNTDCNFIMQLPIVYEGEWKQIKKYAEKKGYRFKEDKKMIYQGYFVNDKGECLMIT